MKPLVRYLQSFGVMLVLFAGMTGAARAVDLSQAVILVASARLAGSPFEQTVILAAPMPQGGHMGFIVNRPTGVKLESLFPEQASSHNVVDPIYVGGPMLSEAIFAVTRAAPDNNGKVFALMPGLVLAIDGATVAIGGVSAAISIARTKPPCWASGPAGSGRNKRRQVISNERDMPWRLAVDDIARGACKLSRTIRSFSSSDHRRRRPVSMTSSRST